MNPNHDDHGRFAAGGSSGGGASAAHERVPTNHQFAPRPAGGGLPPHLKQLADRMGGGARIIDRTPAGYGPRG